MPLMFTEGSTDLINAQNMHRHPVLTKAAPVHIQRTIGSDAATGFQRFLYSQLLNGTSQHQKAPTPSGWATRSIASIDEATGRPWLVGGRLLRSASAEVGKALIADLSTLGISRPQVDVTSDGGLLIQWNRKSFSAEIRVLSDGATVVAYLDESTGQGIDDFVPMTEALLRQLAQHLAA